MAALAILLNDHNHQPGQVTGPARAAKLIDYLRSSGRTLSYDPQDRTLRTDTEDAVAVTVG